MAHHELALVAIMKGVDKIPDKVWDMIPGMKEKAGHSSRAVDSKSEGKTERRRRDSETSKYDRDRYRRSATDSPNTSDREDDRGQRRERGRRSKDYEFKRRSVDYTRPPQAYMTGMPNPLYHPASYPAQSYGQPVPIAYAAVPPANVQMPHAQTYPYAYGTPQSSSSSRSTSNAAPMWSHDASRRSSIYSNNNYSPPSNVSPNMKPHAQPPPPPPPVAYHNHPAYTNGAPASIAEGRYTPSSVQTSQAPPPPSVELSSTPQAGQQASNSPAQSEATHAPSQAPSGFVPQQSAPIAASQVGSYATARRGSTVVPS